MAPGVFRDSLAATSRLPLLLFHDSRSLASMIGVSDAWEDRRDGLYGVWQLDTSDPAQEAARLVSTGILGFMSVGFIPLNTTEEIDRHGNTTLTRTRARLLEVSLTPTPAYPDAQVTDVRHGVRLLNELSERVALAETATRHTTSDHDAHLLAAGLEAIPEPHRTPLRVRVLDWLDQGGPRLAAHRLDQHTATLTEPAAGWARILSEAVRMLTGTPAQDAAALDHMARDYPPRRRR
jgi:HK97 family phage prohead protease